MKWKEKPFEKKRQKLNDKNKTKQNEKKMF